MSPPVGARPGTLACQSTAGSTWSGPEAFCPPAAIIDVTVALRVYVLLLMKTTMQTLNSFLHSFYI